MDKFTSLSGAELNRMRKCIEAYDDRTKEFRVVGSFVEPPVPGAEQRAALVQDVRANKPPSQVWYQHGTNHRVFKGFNCRDMGEEQAWFVKIPDIVDFTRKHGPCTVHVDIFDQPWIYIEALIRDEV